MSGLRIDLPDEVFEQLAQRVAEILEERGVLATSVRSRPEWLTLEQAGERLGCTADAVRMRANRGRLEKRTQGSRVYVSARSVDTLGGAA